MEEFQKTLEAERAEKKAAGARFTLSHYISGLFSLFVPTIPLIVQAKMRTKTRRCDMPKSFQSL